MRELGRLRDLVQTGGGKTGPCSEGGGGGCGEECRDFTGSGNCPSGVACKANCPP